jgi:hypothetical protein
VGHALKTSLSLANAPERLTPETTYGSGNMHSTSCEKAVLCADERPSIQARRRKHPSLPPAPALQARIEHEYERKGAWVYLAAWDVRRAKIFGRCAHRNGIQRFDRLIGEVMDQEPYRSAKRVFWILDNCSVHCG